MTQTKHNGLTCHATFLFLPTKEPAILKGFPLPKKGKPTILQKKKGTTSTLPLSFHNEGGGGQSTPHLFDTESIYLPMHNPSFANGPRLELFPTKPPTQKSLIWAAHKSSK